MHVRLSIGLMCFALAASNDANAQTPAVQAQCSAKPTRACVSALATVPQGGLDGVVTLFHVAEAQLGAGDLKAVSLTVGRAKTAAGALKDDKQRRNALSALAIFETVIKAAEQASAGQAAEASKTMAAIAEQAQESEYISLLFADLAEGHARAGRPAAAADVMGVAATLAAAVKDDAIRRLTLADVAVRQAAVQSQAGRDAEARATAAGLEGNMRRDAFYRIAEASAAAQARSGQAAEALKTLIVIDNASMRVRALCTLADIHAQAARPMEAAEALSRARAAAKAMRDPSERDEAFARIARAQAKAGQLTDAMTSATGLGNDVWRIVALDAIAAAAPG